jgi:hypothetical protein
MTSAPFCVDGEGGFVETGPCCAEAVEADVIQTKDTIANTDKPSAGFMV